MRCRVCSSSKRAAIEEALAGGASIASVAEQFGLNENALAKHAELHPRATVTAPKRARASRATSRASKVATLAPPPPDNGDTTATVEQAPRTCCTPDKPHVIKRGDPLPEVTDGIPHHIEQLGEDEDGPATSRSSELARPRTARERLETLLDRIEALLGELDRDKDISATAKLEGHRSLVTAIRLLAQFTGEVGASETSVAASPFYRRVRTAIVDALRPKEHRAALDAVIAALEQVEGLHAETRTNTTEAAAE